MRQLALLLCCAVAGCANAYGTVSPTSESALTVGNYRALPDDELCAAAWDVRRCAAAPLCATPNSAGALIHAEIERRHLIDATEWPAVDAGQVRRGMSYCPVLAAWGKPTVISDAGAVAVMAFGPSRFVTFAGGKASSVTAPFP